MWKLVNYPIILALVCFAILWAAVVLGYRVRGRLGPLADDEHADLSVVTAATLTLLGLIIGFTFSMSVSRYDLRKHYEAQEANSIGTEYLRVDMLPATEADAVHELMKRYLALRVQFYEIRFNPSKVRQIEIQQADVQKKMWTIVGNVGSTKPSATIALAVSGMNQVIDNQGYAQAAWWNRIPRAAWLLMLLIATCSTFLVGYSSRKRGRLLYMVLPAAIAISFMLIADIDSPRTGLIPIHPDNLRSLAETMGR